MSAAIAAMFAAGVAPEIIAMVAQELADAKEANHKPRSANAERQARFRERAREKAKGVTEIVTDPVISRYGNNALGVTPAEPRAGVLCGEELDIKKLPTVVKKTEPSVTDEAPKPETDLFGSKPQNVTSLRSAKKAAEQRLLDFVGESWNAFAAECPRACAITLIPDGSDRERLILARSRDLVKDHEYLDAETGWKAFFAKIRGSPFLRGEAKPGIGRERSFKPRLDAMIAPAFFLKIMEPDSPYGPEVSIKRNTHNGYGAHR